MKTLKAAIILSGILSFSALADSGLNISPEIKSKCKSETSIFMGSFADYYSGMNLEKLNAKYEHLFNGFAGDVFNQVIGRKTRDRYQATQQDIRSLNSPVVLTHLTNTCEVSYAKPEVLKKYFRK